MREACREAGKSECNYGIGCLAEKNEEVLIKNYNERIPGEVYCIDGKCIREELNLFGGNQVEKVCTIHAEANMIVEAMKKGVSLTGSTLYITAFPCLPCSKMLAKLKIGKLIFMNNYLKENHLVVQFAIQKKKWQKYQILMI